MEWWKVMFAVAGGVVALGGAAKVVTAVVRQARKASRFVDALWGKPGEFGRDPEDGLIEKVDKILQTQAQHTDDLMKIKHEVFPNSSKSLRDVVDRIEEKLANHLDEISGGEVTNKPV